MYLASASPRRRELLAQIGVEFEVVPALIDEQLRSSELPEDYVVRLARAKANAVWESVAKQPQPRPVLAADTAVVIDHRILGKPDNEHEALRMLELLSDRSHIVLTAIALRLGGTLETTLSTSEVRFRATTATERAAYCHSGEPLDKAGSYAIQGIGAVFVERLHGSYSGVMGLPLFETAALLGKFGVPVWSEADQEAG